MDDETEASIADLTDWRENRLRDGYPVESLDRALRVLEAHRRLRGAVLDVLEGSPLDREGRNRDDDGMGMGWEASAACVRAWANHLRRGMRP